MLPLDREYSLIFDYPDHKDGYRIFRQGADTKDSYGFVFKKDGTLVYQDIEIKNVFCYEPGLHDAYILTADGEIYVFAKEDKSLVKLAEGVALPYSTVTLDSYLSSLDSEAWYYEYIKYVYTKGLCNGIPMSDFVPNRNLTRAMLVQMLYNLEGQPKVSSQNQYDDVHAGDWYENATVWATDNGIINGYGNGKFGPNDPILREQVVAIIYRYATIIQLKKYKVIYSSSTRGTIVFFSFILRVTKSFFYMLFAKVVKRHQGKK
ncbi:MAG: S-layer homology domain-containing protein [Firmicutes bacterium]|nr:S-layer homology domain-containing protein [Bacillota bacterium]